MKRLLLSMAAVPLMVGSLSVSASADDGINILNDVKVKGQIRPRYEYANQKSNHKDQANAFTARTHLTVTGGLLGVENLTATVGLQGVNNFGYTHYAPADEAYDKILDPQGAMLSEASIDYSIDKTALHVGRSQINLDDQRFIGTVGWRQMERSYDTVYAANSSVKNLNLLAAYVYGYAGVGGTTTTNTNSVLLHAKYTVSPALSVTAFGYLLADIHDTYGLRLTGKMPLDSVKLSYSASYAMQSKASMDYKSADNADIDANYLEASLTANMQGMILGAGYEDLGKANGSSTKGFTTPLATLHKFQGFADEFLGQTKASNNNGLTDINVKAGYVAKGFGKALVFYHNFTADTGVSDLGSEIDALYANKIPGFKGLKGLLKAAFYSAGEAGSGHTNDTTRLWAQLDYRF